MSLEDVKSVVWLVPALPVLAAIINAIISISTLASRKKKNLTPAQRTLRNLTAIIGIVAIASALVISLLIMIALIGSSGEKRIEVKDIYTWIPAGDFQIHLGFLIDPLTSMMLVVVNTISLMVHIFSTGYMKEDDGLHRFYTYLPFFTFSMLMLVLADNFLLLYVFWEAVGLSSYLLIGFWFSKKNDWGRLLPPEASKKAFIANRFGDFGFSLGIMYIFVQMLQLKTGGTDNMYDRLSYDNVFANLTNDNVGSTTITIIALLLFCGAMGKSAQIPLNVWLPDAMAGPTPVSALIHAATMVTAGVYMVGRVNPIFSQSATAMTVVAVIGVLTAFFGATVGTTQKDIKAVMAYSTVSQLGYMFFSLGVLGWVAAFFHLMTHAFFKGLLFLGCGSIIHANEDTIHEGFHEMQEKLEAWAKLQYPNDHEKAEEIAFELFEAGEHAVEYGVDPNSKDELLKRGLDPQSMDYLGNLSKGMPITAYSMVFGAAALAGIPLTAGFWSKDDILGQAFFHDQYIIYAIGLLAAFLTAFYSFRMIFSTFFSGSFRLPTAMNTLAWAGLNAKARELGIANFDAAQVINFTDGYEAAKAAGTKHIHGAVTQPNSPNVAIAVVDGSRSMTTPLIFLAIMSVLAGYLGLPKKIFGDAADLIDNFFEPVFADTAYKQKAPLYSDFTTTLILLGVSGLIAIAGVTVAYLMYNKRRETAPLAARRMAGPLYNISYRKWYFDEVWNAIIGTGGKAFGKLLWLFDRGVIDGVVNGTGWVTRQTASQMRKLQTGFVANYALFMAVGLVAIVAIFYIVVSPIK